MILHVHVLMMNDQDAECEFMQNQFNTDDPNLTLPLVVFIGILMGFTTLWLLSDVIKISKFVEFLYGYVISTY